MKALFNKYEAFSKEGAELSDKFNEIVSDFVKEQCLAHNTREVESILMNELNGIICTSRIEKAFKLKRHPTACTGLDCVTPKKERGI